MSYTLDVFEQCRIRIRRSGWKVKNTPSPRLKWDTCRDLVPKLCKKKDQRKMEKQEKKRKIKEKKLAQLNALEELSFKKIYPFVSLANNWSNFHHIFIIVVLIDNI